MPVIEVVQRIEVPEIPDIKLPYDDGEPLEPNWHRVQINLLGDALHHHWPERSDYFADGNMFVYYCLEQARAQDDKGPDFFVVPGRGWDPPTTILDRLAGCEQSWNGYAAQYLKQRSRVTLNPRCSNPAVLTFQHLITYLMTSSHSTG